MESSLKNGRKVWWDVETRSDGEEELTVSIQRQVVLRVDTSQMKFHEALALAVSTFEDLEAGRISEAEVRASRFGVSNGK